MSSKTCPPKELRKPRLGIPDSYSHDDHQSEVSNGSRVCCVKLTHVLMATTGQVIVGARDRGVSESRSRRG